MVDYVKGPHLTDGIGARIAQNIHGISTRDALPDPLRTSVTSAKREKTDKSARHNGRIPCALRFALSKFSSNSKLKVYEVSS